MFKTQFHLLFLAMSNNILFIKISANGQYFVQLDKLHVTIPTHCLCNICFHFPSIQCVMYTTITHIDYSAIALREQNVG